MPSFTCLAVIAVTAILSACSGRMDPGLGAVEKLEIPDLGHVTGPRITAGPDGSPTLSWIQRVESAAILQYAALSMDGLGAVHDVVTEPRMFVNWADLPSVMHVAEDRWIAHWLRYSADETYSYDVVVAQSSDGETWTDPISAHTDGTTTEHGFVSMFRAGDGVGLLWLDGRETPDKPMTLRSGVISPTGERFHEQLVDASVCDCCQTDIAVASNGPVAVYRDRTEAEIRDIYFTRFIDNQWLPGQRLYADNWHIGGCPVNGPSIVAQGDEVAVAWFSAADDHPVVQLVRSSDGGMTFAAPIEIAAGKLAGYVGLAALTDGRFAVSWVARGDDGTNQLFVTLVMDDGTMAKPAPVSSISQMRVFPQLTYWQEHLLLAWTDEVEDSRQLRVARIAVLPSQ